MEGLNVLNKERQALWEQRYDELGLYVKENDNANVPYGYDANRQLGTWVHKQRTNFKNGKLSEERMNRLKDLSFVFSFGPKIPWQQRYDEMAIYVKEHGNANIPKRYDANPQLGGWVHTQRAYFRDGKLSDERISSLNDLGFVFRCQRTKKSNDKKRDTIEMKKEGTPPSSHSSPKFVVHSEQPSEGAASIRMEGLDALNRCRLYKQRQALWEQRCDELRLCVRENDNSNVPHGYEENRQLGAVVHKQQTSFRNGKLSEEERMKRLNDLSFVFSFGVPQIPWQQRYDEMATYVKEHGNANVPRGYVANPQLGGWIHTQRAFFRDGKLSEERISRLNDLGFVFRCQRTKKGSGEKRDTDEMKKEGAPLSSHSSPL